ncbi:putative thiamine transporter SLC35F3 [Sinocyclocheilus grahami]|uniref:putative thiamine transporter SLC35F3 n=1 Tax=Sinocyclocheilus grahami TaxID=75366 RepID=UPI0007AD4013|nr:PREDICTED: putative thiamine transporter SLC35F3 [Sinocyclocheilus grahami]
MRLELRLSELVNMKKHSARVAPLSACNSPVLTLTKVRGEDRPRENIVGNADGQAMVGGAGVESGAGRQRLHCCVRVTAIQVRKAIWGVAMVMCVCSSWAGSTQLAKLTFKQYDAPFTLTWFTTTWNCLFFPLYYIGHLCKSPERQTPKQRFRECCRFFGDDGLTAKVFFTKVAPFGLLWIMTNYLYLQALRKINSTDVSALFCCNKAFVFLLSWIVLRDRFMGVRIVAAILAIAGIVMLTYADGFHSHSVIGITLVVASASASALYKVLFKLVLGSAKFGEAALFLTIVGGANFVFMSFVPVILYFTHVEYFTSIADLPWAYLCGVAGLLLAFNILVNFGIAITYPTLISLGIVLSVPVNAVVDLYTCDIHFNTVRLIAVFIICLGFLMLLLPEDWDQCLIELGTIWPGQGGFGGLHQSYTNIGSPAQEESGDDREQPQDSMMLSLVGILRDTAMDLSQERV